MDRQRPHRRTLQSRGTLARFAGTAVRVGSGMSSNGGQTGNKGLRRQSKPCLQVAAAAVPAARAAPAAGGSRAGPPRTHRCAPGHVHLLLVLRHVAGAHAPLLADRAVGAPAGRDDPLTGLHREVGVGRASVRRPVGMIGSPERGRCKRGRRRWRRWLPAAATMVHRCGWGSLTKTPASLLLAAALQEQERASVSAPRSLCSLEEAGPTLRQLNLMWGAPGVAQAMRMGAGWAGRKLGEPSWPVLARKTARRLPAAHRSHLESNHLAPSISVQPSHLWPRWQASLRGAGPSRTSPPIRVMARGC